MLNIIFVRNCLGYAQRLVYQVCNGTTWLGFCLTSQKLPRLRWRSGIAGNWRPRALLGMFFKCLPLGCLWLDAFWQTLGTSPRCYIVIALPQNFDHNLAADGVVFVGMCCSLLGWFPLNLLIVILGLVRLLSYPLCEWFHAFLQRIASSIFDVQGVIVSPRFGKMMPIDCRTVFKTIALNWRTS
jgi:hypothetical protein